MKYSFPLFILACMGIVFFSLKQVKVIEQYSFSNVSFSEDEFTFPAGQTQDKGIGPVKELKLGAIDKKLSGQGQQLFTERCVACHSLDQQIIGPPLRNVTKKRTPEFIMNMILNPTTMEKEDPVVKDLHKKYIATPMANQGFTQDQARSLLEYLRSSEK